MFTKKICLEAKQCIAKAMLEPELNAWYDVQQTRI
jgi:hypothetical protein